MKIEPGAPNDLVIKREKAIEYLREQRIWRGEPMCAHVWNHNPNAQFYEAKKITVAKRAPMEE